MVVHIFSGAEWARWCYWYEREKIVSYSRPVLYLKLETDKATTLCDVSGILCQQSPSNCRLRRAHINVARSKCYSLPKLKYYYRI